MATVRKIFDLATAKIFEEKGSDIDYDKYASALLEGLLVEALPYENRVRRAAGKPELETAPEVDAIDETVIDWDDRIARVALPYGLAAALLFDDENHKAEMVMMRNEFVAALDEIAPAVFEDIHYA